MGREYDGQHLGAAISPKYARRIYCTDCSGNRYPPGMKILTVPGLNGSGPLHWQTKWETKYGFVRVEQNDWAAPIFALWEKTLLNYVNHCPHDNGIVLIAHSLGCHLVLKSLPRIKSPVKGIFLVAPPDLRSPVLKMDLADFDKSSAPNPDMRGYLVYSENDHYASAAYSDTLAREYGLQCFNAGRLGHINSDSHLGDWDEGYTLFQEFLRSLHTMEPR